MMARDQSTILLALLVSSAILAVSCSPTTTVPETKSGNSSARATSLDLASQIGNSQRSLFIKVEDWIPKIKDCAKHLIQVLQEVIGDLKECLKDGFKSCKIDICLKKIGYGLKDGVKILGDNSYSSKRQKSNGLTGAVDGIQELVESVGSSLTGLLNQSKSNKDTSEKPKSKSRSLELFE